MKRILAELVPIPPFLVLSGQTYGAPGQPTIAAPTWSIVQACVGDIGLRTFEIQATNNLASDNDQRQVNLFVPCLAGANHAPAR